MKGDWRKSEKWEKGKGTTGGVRVRGIEGERNRKEVTKQPEESGVERETGMEKGLEND